MLQIVQGSVSDLFWKYSLKELAHKCHSFCKSVYTDYAVCFWFTKQQTQYWYHSNKENKYFNCAHIDWPIVALFFSHILKTVNRVVTTFEPVWLHIHQI